MGVMTVGVFPMAVNIFDLRLIRSRFAASALEVEAKTLPDLVGRWKTHLDSPR